MKIQVTVTKSSTITNQADFPSMEEAQAWVDSHVSMGSFGSPRYAMQSVEIAPAVIDEEELLDSEGLSFDPPQFQDVEISPAQFEDQLVEVNPEGYEISIVDVSAAEAQKAINKEAEEFLSSSDWKILRHLRQQALGIATSLTSQEFLELEQERQMAADSIVR